MASSLMHLAVARQLAPRLPLDDPNRFFVGSVLPDAAPSGDSHFRRALAGDRVVMDAAAFRQAFPGRIPGDGLYLGYYFHLIQDDVFRRLLYYDLGLLHRRGEALAEELHRDYARLNHALAARYALPALTLPEDFETEALCGIAPFAPIPFLAGCEAQRLAHPGPEPALLDLPAAQGYIDRCTALCQREYRALLGGRSAFRPEDWAWERGGGA